MELKASEERCRAGSLLKWHGPSDANRSKRAGWSDEKFDGVARSYGRRYLYRPSGSAVGGNVAAVATLACSSLQYSCTLQSTNGSVAEPQKVRRATYGYYMESFNVRLGVASQTLADGTRSAVCRPYRMIAGCTGEGGQGEAAGVASALIRMMSAIWAYAVPWP